MRERRISLNDTLQRIGKIRSIIKQRIRIISWRVINNRKIVMIDIVNL